MLCHLAAPEPVPPGGLGLFLTGLRCPGGGSGGPAGPGGRRRRAGPPEEGHGVGDGLSLELLRLLLGPQLLVDDDLDVILPGF